MIARVGEELASALARMGIRDPRVLAAIAAVARALFVPGDLRPVASCRSRATHREPGREVHSIPMIVCPVCEHAQPPGVECVVCGMAFGPPGARALGPVERLDGLEPTLHAGVSAASDTIPDLEPTAAAAVDAVTAVVVPDLEPTAAAGLPGDGPTPEPMVILCRYCRSPAMPGERICAHCGMRLPVTAATRAQPADAGTLERCGCGVPLSGPLCRSCGARRGATL